MTESEQNTLRILRTKLEIREKIKRNAQGLRDLVKLSAEEKIKATVIARGKGPEIAPEHEPEDCTDQIEVLIRALPQLKIGDALYFPQRSARFARRASEELNYVRRSKMFETYAAQNFGVIVKRIK